MEDYRKQIADEEANKNAEKRKLLGIPDTNPEDKGKVSKDNDMVHSLKMNKALGILERMVNQNAEDEIFQDFKFWEDVSMFFAVLYKNIFHSIILQPMQHTY